MLPLRETGQRVQGFSILKLHENLHYLNKKFVCKFLPLSSESAATPSSLRFGVLSTDHGERQGRVVLGQGCSVETCVLVGMRCNKIVCPRVLISGDVHPLPSETFTWGQVCPDGTRGGSPPESGSGSPGGNLKWDSPHWPHLVSSLNQESDVCHRGDHRLVPMSSGKKELLPCHKDVAKARSSGLPVLLVGTESSRAHMCL